MNCIVILCDTLRPDHCGAYNHGRPLNECGCPEQPNWTVPTPNLDRLAERGTVFDNAWCGSTPCMPARRDIYTGRYEFLERGWGPLKEDDLDLPHQISGKSNLSIRSMLENGKHISGLITDHFHLWEEGSGNYHMGYTSFEFIRGQESDAWRIDPIDFPCPPQFQHTQVERFYRHMALTYKEEKDYHVAQTFSAAAKWLERNHTYKNFYLHIDSFTPHEVWEPPEELVKMFDPRGYSDNNGSPAGPYDEWRKHMSEGDLLNTQARYAAQVVLTDRWLGKFLDKMDELNLWEDTVVIFTSDHGTFNGDRGRIGKGQTHLHESTGHIPFIVAHPQLAHGERRQQMVQLVDIYPTVLESLGLPCPPNRHGVNLLPVLENAETPTRDWAISGTFGRSMTLTDGKWILHQSPVPENKPLYWYDYHWNDYTSHLTLGDYEDGRREATLQPGEVDTWHKGTWLSDKTKDYAELVNLADENPEKLREMQRILKQQLQELGAPSEQLERLGLKEV